MDLLFVLLVFIALGYSSIARYGYKISSYYVQSLLFLLYDSEINKDKQN